MDLLYPSPSLQRPAQALRSAGYFPFTDKISGESSFVLRLGPDFYPRFHVYISERAGEIRISLHLDQKQPSYGSGRAHAGEYDGATVEKEMKRIDGWVRQEIMISQGDTNNIKTSESVTPARSWWKKLFG